MNLKKLSNNLRFLLIKISNKAKTPHLASSLSCIDIVATLYHSVLKINKKNFKSSERNRFILSKGHAATSLYVALKYKNIITKKELNSYSKQGSLLEEHPSPKMPGVEAATGSLGHGLSIACGIALSSKITNKNFMTYVLMSDGECNEGSVWEAALFASAKRLNNLCAFIDYNKWQATGKTKDILNLGSLTKKFKQFGWNVIEIDGHNHDLIFKACQRAIKEKHKPTMVIANTTKGKGVSFMEDDNNWHYKIPSDEEVKMSQKELDIK
jgi:transketolase